MRIAILGCGPAGLMAAHGAKMASIEQELPTEMLIFSRKRVSPLYGAQYLHEPIPGHTRSMPVTVNYQLRGSADDYRRKVYGPKWEGTVSPEDLTDTHQAWDIRQTYESLWSVYHHMIQDIWVDPMAVRRVIDSGADIIINSIPRPEICYRDHSFGMTEITAAGDAPKLGIQIPFSCPPNTVVCNGDDNPSWYRLSNVFGHKTVEWPAGLAVPVPTAAKVRKPTYHDCNCWDGKVYHVGRYGRWEKGVLSHTAFVDSYNIVKESLRAAEEAAAG